MPTASRSWLRIALCLHFAVGQLCPAAAAVATVVPARGAQPTAIPGVSGQPLSTSPAGLGVPGLGTGLTPSLLGGIPLLPAPAVRPVAALVAPAAALARSSAAAPRAAAAVAAVKAAAPALAAPAARSARVSVIEGLARTGSLLDAGQERGAQENGAILDALYDRDARRAAAGPSAVDAAPAASEVPPRLEASRGASAPLSPRIVRTVDETGRNVVLEVGVSDLLRAISVRSRDGLAHRVAREALSALGTADPDGRRAAALGDFLRDIVDYRADGTVSARLEMDGKNHYRLIFERRDGGRRVLPGQFLPGTAPDGRRGPEAFILMGPAEVSADDEVRQNHPGYWREYAGGDLRREWRATPRVEKMGWGPWAYVLKVRDAFLAEHVWRGVRWRDQEKRKVRTLAAGQTRSWLGRAAEELMKAPLLGPVLTFCDDAAETVLTGMMIAQHLVIRAFAGPGRYDLEAGGDFAKNPLLKRLMSDQRHLDRLSPAARKKLFARVREERAAAVKRQVFPVSPELARQVRNAPIGAAEAVAFLRSGFGIGTFGRRLIHEGAEKEGWRRLGLIAAGVLTGAAEGLAGSVSSPLLWAMVGAEAGAVTGLFALRALHAALTALWVGPWLFSVTDHVGRMVHLTAKGEFDKDYFRHLSTAGADALIYFIVP